jgi:crotonobetainyl-CoA:carnitine CoA-transferase CaiB-like acyl-CoA transferase
MLLADHGADVIKIEPPDGDSARIMPPFVNGESAPFMTWNRNKRSVVLDLKQPDDKARFWALAERADIVLENYRPGVLARLGLGWDVLHARNPRLVLGSISGFGQTGPYSSRGGFDLITQAMSGLMSVNGPPEGDPYRLPIAISDVAAGMFLAFGVMAAIEARHRTGEGQHVETSLLESALAYTVWETGLYLTTGEVAKRQGTRHRLAAPYEALKTADGHMVVGVNNQRLWVRFCEALGEPGLATEEAFERPNRRVRNRDALQARLEAILAHDTTAGWIAKLEAKGVPAGPLNTIAEAWDDPQVKARGLLAEAGGRRFVRTPIKLHETPVALTRGPAEVGEHTREVLAEGGFSNDEIAALIESGAAAVERKEVPA